MEKESKSVGLEKEDVLNPVYGDKPGSKLDDDNESSTKLAIEITNQDIPLLLFYKVLPLRKLCLLCQPSTNDSLVYLNIKNVYVQIGKCIFFTFTF